MVLRDSDHRLLHSRAIGTLPHPLGRRTRDAGGGGYFVRGPRLQPLSYSVLRIGDPAAPDGRIRGLLPGEITLVMSAPGYVEESLPLWVLQPGQVVDVTAHLQPAN